MKRKKALPTFFLLGLNFHSIFFPGRTLVVVEFFLASWGVHSILTITKTFSPTSFSPSP